MTTATRVFVSVSPKSSHNGTAWGFPDSTVQFALQLIKESQLLLDDEFPRPLILAKERWHRIHIAFDIFNDNYDSSTAHLADRNDLPVIAVSLGGNGHDDQNKASIAPSSLQQEVNQTIRNLHDWNGDGSQPPFCRRSRKW
ncbi:hypothetical protein F5X99DRAFT_82116 [Biscogniauxia marginata]|nr:hypothetical protein F5X99DRAFT_82116 [Biscogniauxia marginata]